MSTPAELIRTLRANNFDDAADAIECLQAQVEVLRGMIREYLGEYDTPAKDYSYRHQCREKLRAALNQAGTIEVGK